MPYAPAPRKIPAKRRMRCSNKDVHNSICYRLSVGHQQQLKNSLSVPRSTATEMCCTWTKQLRLKYLEVRGVDQERRPLGNVHESREC